jgi:micrococcal nuclease
LYARRNGIKEKKIDGNPEIRESSIEFNLVLKRTRKRIIFFYFSFVILVLTVGTIPSSPALQQQQSKMLEYALASVITSVPENNYGGIVTRVIDGDTLDIKTTTNDEADIITIRLVLVDAPESNEQGYTEAKTFVSENCLDKHVIVDPDNNQDLSYNRFVALVYCDGVNINEAVIAAGLADIYKSFCAISEFGNTDWAQNYGCDNNNDSGSSFSSRSSNSDNGSSEDSKIGELTENCDSSYSGVCIPSPPPDLDCGDIPHKNFRVLAPDPHRFDGEGDGIGCEN